VSAVPSDDALVEALARSAVEQVAPEELPLFRATSEAYFADPASLEQGRSRDDLLGFGVDAALVLVSPVALQVAKEVIGFVVAQFREAAAEEGEGAIRRLVARLVHRNDVEEDDTDEPVPELTDEQLQQVRALALEKARSLKLSDTKATLLADSLVGSLATA
jgi:hypothetical protein